MSTPSGHRAHLRLVHEHEPAVGWRRTRHAQGHRKPACHRCERDDALGGFASLEDLTNAVLAARERKGEEDR